MVEYILDAFLLKVEFRYELVSTLQWGFESHGEASHYRIDSLLMKCSKTDTHRRQKLVTGMFQIVLIIGIIDDALQVAFIVAYLHF